MTHRVPRLSAAQHGEAAVVLLAATLRLPQLLRTLVIGQIEHLLGFTLVFHLQTHRTNTITAPSERGYLQTCRLTTDHTDQFKYKDE